MWRHLDRCLEAPELAPLKTWFARNVVREPQA
jgi:aminoglycoside/choline kinase family phosphotransferase